MLHSTVVQTFSLADHTVIHTTARSTEHILGGYIGSNKIPQSKERWCHIFHTKDRWRCPSLVSVPVCQECGIHYEVFPSVDAEMICTVSAAAVHIYILLQFFPTLSSLQILSCMVVGQQWHVPLLEPYIHTIDAGVCAREELCLKSFIHERWSELLGQVGDRFRRRIFPLCLIILRERV